MLTAENWRTVQDILVRVLECEPGGREDLLRQLCHEDAALFEEVASLEAAFEDAGGFLDELSPEKIAVLLAEPGDPGGTGAREIELEAGATIGPYRIERRLGRGGMGIVYVGRDVRLDRRVALKFLPAEVAPDEEAQQRLRIEARAAAALDHPNIGVVHEIAESEEGRPFIAMGYYDGETLQERLARGPIPPLDAIDIARQIASGLHAAHRQAIIHRDVKPSNILLTESGGMRGEGVTVKIVDFGIARMLQTDATSVGAARGTIAYMSPEQTRGDPLDVRTDVWSLGVLLYEMLAGERPFRGETDRTLIHAIRFDDPRPVNQLSPDVAPSLARSVHRCLEKDVSRRYADCEALLHDLRAVEAGGGVPARRWRWVGRVAAMGVLITLLAVLYLRLQPDEPSDGTEAAKVARLVILPFDNLSPDPADEYVAVGMTSEVNSRLTRLSGVHVVGRASTRQLADGSRTLSEIGRALRASAVLQGSVRKADDRFRVSLQLVAMDTEEPVWEHTIDVEAKEMSNVGSDIAQRIAEALHVRLRASERSGLDRAIRNVEAFEHYMRGRYYLDKFDEASVRGARGHFQQALDLDPAFAEAWAGLADAYKVFDYHALMSPDEASPRARAAAERALELDPDLAEAHAALATVLADYYHDWERAGTHYRRATELDPSYAVGRQLYAEFLRDMGLFDEALLEIRIAQELDPLSPFYQLVEGIILHFARRYGESLSKYERLIQFHPEYGMAHFYAGLVSADSGLHDVALARMHAFDPGRSSPETEGVRGASLAALGRHREAREVLFALGEMSERRYVSPFLFAIVHLALGEREIAIDLLERTAEERNWFVRLFNVLPMLDRLRSEPRFQELVARVGLPPAPAGAADTNLGD